MRDLNETEKQALLTKAENALNTLSGRHCVPSPGGSDHAKALDAQSDRAAFTQAVAKNFPNMIERHQYRHHHKPILHLNSKGEEG